MQHRLSRRSVLRGMGAVAGAGVLAACAAQTPQTVERVVEKVVTPTPAGGAEATVTIFDWDPAGDEVVNQANATFDTYFAEKYPSIKVVRVPVPFEGMNEKLLTTLAGGAKYDLVYGYWVWLPQFIKNNVVTPYDDLLDTDPEVSLDDIYDYGKEVVDGKVYGLAIFLNARLLFYNKTALAEAGQPDPWELDQKGEWNYAAWYDIAKNTTGDKDGTKVFGFDMGPTRKQTVMICLAWAYGTAFWDSGFTKSLMNSPENLEVWKYVQQFFAEGLSPLPGQTMAEGEAPGYANERIVGIIGGNLSTRGFATDKVPDVFDIGMARWPSGPEGSFSTCGANSYYMLKPEFPDATWLWVKERTLSATADRIYAPEGEVGRFPLRKSAEPVTLYDFENPDVYQAIRPVLRPYPISPVENDFMEAHAAAWDELVLQSRPVSDILGQLAADADSLLF